MTHRLNPNWIHKLKVFMLSATLTLGTASIHTFEVWAQPTLSISQTIENLKNSDKRWLQVDLSEQRLVAWQGKTPMYGVIVSTGKKKTPTPTGVFKIYTKLRKTRMKGEDYDIPDVPYTMYYQGGYGIHGAFWHNNFGTPVSHGCVNVAPDHAKWLFNFASVGTPVVVKE